MENETQSQTQDTSRPFYAVVLAIVLFVIIPLIILIISTINQINSSISTEDALQSNTDEAIAQAILEQNDIDPANTVFHKVASEGNWHAVVVSSTSPNTLGNSTLVILQYDENQGYQTVYIGTGCGNESLIELGVPSNLAQKLTDTDIISQYSQAIYQSYLNPDYKYSLVQNLPYYSDKSSITFHYDDGLKDQEGVSIPIIEIASTNPAERANALDKIRRLGYDVGDYYITFTDFTNPFTEEEVVEEVIIDVNKVEGEQAP